MSTPMIADHWYWRPGWRVGRRFYTWHLTFQECPDLHAHAAVYREALAGIPTFDLVPDRWLHLTMQGVGFVDEVGQGDINAIERAARKRLATLAPLALEFGVPAIANEGVLWRLDTAVVSPVRAAIRAAIGDVWPSVPEASDEFTAHVSLAYANAVGLGEPVTAALAKADAAPVTVSVDTVELIVLHRDDRMYEWMTYAAVPLGGT